MVEALSDPEDELNKALARQEQVDGGPAEVRPDTRFYDLVVGFGVITMVNVIFGMTLGPVGHVVEMVTGTTLGPAGHAVEVAIYYAFLRGFRLVGRWLFPGDEDY